MQSTVSLKNADAQVVLDQHVLDHLQQDNYLSGIRFLENLRRHSSGYAFYQKNWPKEKGIYRNETIYLHKYIAARFIEKPQTDKKLVVMFKNGDPLDCRLENMTWADLGLVARNTPKTENVNGYRGVVKQGDKYKAIIYHEKKRLVLGVFDTPEDAAHAYNSKSTELFGHTLGLNRIRPDLN